MSEPVTNAEIEDVLSSIRKLVSENATPDATSSDPVASNEKLVLTPAFRVHETPEVHEAAPQEEAEAGHEDHDNHGIDTDDQSDAYEDAPADDHGHDHHANHDHDDHDHDDAEEGHQDIPDADHDDSLEGRIAELEAAVSDSEDDWEPDGSEDEVDTPQTVVFEHAAWAGAPEEVEDAIELDAQPEGAPQDHVEEVEPAQAEEAVAWPDDAVENDFEAEFDEAVIDEDALRELVARLVREELQGSIGERITRNVRRLVRREIQRALTLKDFE